MGHFVRYHSVTVTSKVLSWHLPGETEENHENLGQNSMSLNRDVNPGPPKYKEGVLTTLLLGIVGWYFPYRHTDPVKRGRGSV
jgi:hypothetical protein